jgi:hypothetical protein
MAPGPDGRVVGCRYCGTRIQAAIGADQIAAGMALDLSNIDAFLGRLAATLQQGFAEHARIESSGSHVASIEVSLEPDVFSVRREGGHAVAQHKKIVRGIALRTSTVPLDRWVDLLLAALAAHANENARAAWVLGQFGGPR